MTDAANIIKLDQFEVQFLQYLNVLRQENQWCDVQFNVNGKTFACHRLVLISVSPYFRTMFNGNFKESSSDVVSLNEINSEAFEEILNAIYTANIRLLPSNAYFILRTGHLLQLEMIVNACVSYIVKHPKINYLIDTCIFAQNIQQENLHSTCVRTITEDVFNYGKTDAFVKIPFDIFKSILSDCKFSQPEEEQLFLLILKWSKSNEANRNDIQVLLETAKLKTIEYISASVIAELMATSDDTFFNDGNNTKIFHNDINSRMDFKLYLEAINVKTEEKGWCLLKMNNQFDKYIVSFFHPGDTPSKVCSVGSMIYTLNLDCTVFTRYNIADNSQTVLKTPKRFLVHGCCGMATRDNLIYFLEKNCHSFTVWIYNCAINFWRNTRQHPIDEENDEIFDAPLFSDEIDESSGEETDECCEGDEDSDEVLKYYNNFSSGAFLDGVFYVTASYINDPETYIILRINTKTSSSNDELLSDDQDTWLGEDMKPTIYAFDDKIVLSGSSCDDFSRDLFEIFDMTAKKWIDESDVKPMTISRSNHKLIHHNGFIYVVENCRSFVTTNEKYDLKANKWIRIPSLPKRVALKDTNDTRVVSTGRVFGIEMNSA